MQYDSNPYAFDPSDDDMDPTDSRPPEEDQNIISSMGYLPLSLISTVVSLICLKHPAPKVRFHGAQSFAYWLAVFALYLVFSFGVFSAFLFSLNSNSNSEIVAPLLLFVPMVFTAIFGFIVPIFLAVRVYQGNNPRLPLVGDWIAKKVGFQTETPKTSFHRFETFKMQP